MGATAQTFIPELCDALREDWYPFLTETAIQSNKTLRDNIRDKIFNDWSNERGNIDSPWGDSRIKLFLRYWLKNPSEELKSSSRDNIKKATEEKIRRKNAISEREKKKIEQVAEELPDNVIVSEEEEKNQNTMKSFLKHYKS